MPGTRTAPDTEEIPSSDETPRIEPAEIIARARQSILDGTHWFDALLDAVAVWTLPEEDFDGRRFRYLIGREAFDWLLLAQRLTEAISDLVPPADREAMLFQGKLPGDVSEEELRERFGQRKYRAHLNFFYGVTVEEALQLAVEEELAKNRTGYVWSDLGEEIFVARAVFPETVERLRRHFEVEDNPADEIFDKAALIARLQGKAGVFTTGSERVDADVLASRPQLRVVANMAVGYNNLDIAACTARGVLATNTPDVLTETTADFGFALMMAAARRMAESEHFLRRGEWNRWAYDMFTGSDVHGATLGILGMGRIGQGIARRGALGFGMKVIYHNRSRLAPGLEAPLGARFVDKATLLREADHLVLVLPYTPQSHHAIGAEELRQMKPGAVMVTTAIASQPGHSRTTNRRRWAPRHCARGATALRF